MLIWRNNIKRTMNISHCDSFEDIPIIYHGNPSTAVDTTPPRREEIVVAIKTLKDGKAAGYDGILPEFLKSDREVCSRLLKGIFTRVWVDEIIPCQWKRSVIVKLPKKGDRGKCNNWRGISLIPTVMKIFNNIILGRIMQTLEE